MPPNNRYKRVKRGGRTFYVHRLVWEAAYGPIPKGYNVHHRNNDPQDNRLENLTLLSRPEHARVHSRKVLKGSRWAIAYDACIDCGTTERPHYAKGRCHRCYLREYMPRYYAR